MFKAFVLMQIKGERIAQNFEIEQFFVKTIL